METEPCMRRAQRRWKMSEEVVKLGSTRVLDEEKRRAIARCYALLLSLVEDETADPGEPAGQQAPEPADANPPLRRGLPDE